MLCFLGLKVMHPVANRQKYREALQEIKHYLSLKPEVEVEDNEYILTVSSGDYALSLAKHPYYLHSCHFNLPVLNQKDFQFLDTAYECLMILRETFPSKIGIEIVTDGEEKEIEGFEERKKEEFVRRVNSGLKALVEAKCDLTSDDIEDVIFLCCSNYYTRKNKNTALKLLLSKISTSNLQYPAQYIESLQKLSDQAQLRKLVIELTTKIKAMHRESELDKENSMRCSNLSHIELDPETLKISPLIFQLKQSYNIERICLLLASALGKDNGRKFVEQMESSVTLVANRFINEEYEEGGTFGLELFQLISAYWEKRGKEWSPVQRQGFQRKLREGTGMSRSTLNRSKLPSSRKMNAV